MKYKYIYKIDRERSIKRLIGCEGDRDRQRYAEIDRERGRERERVWTNTSHK
jgi:hypothetical protein